MALLARARAKDPEAGYVPDAITSLTAASWRRSPSAGSRS